MTDDEFRAEMARLRLQLQERTREVAARERDVIRCERDVIRYKRMRRAFMVGLILLGALGVFWNLVLAGVFS